MNNEKTVDELYLENIGFEGHALCNKIQKQPLFYESSIGEFYKEFFNHIQHDQQNHITFTSFYYAYFNPNKEEKLNSLIELKKELNDNLNGIYINHTFIKLEIDKNIYNDSRLSLNDFNEYKYKNRSRDSFFLSRLIIEVDNEITKVKQGNVVALNSFNHSIFETKEVWGLFLAILKKVKIVPDNNTLLGNHIAPMLGYKPVQLSQVITTANKYRNHEINIDNIEIIEDAINEIQQEILRLKQPKK